MKSHILINYFDFLSGFAPQDIDTLVTNDWSPNYLIAILSGVILALAFQLILTVLSVASGISVVGNLKEKFVESKVNPEQNSNSVKESHSHSQDHDTGTATGVTVTRLFGLWSVITTCLSLFGATYIAVRMSVFSIDRSDIATGLVIWALFFTILFYLEIKVANTVIGGLVNTALSGVRSTGELIKSALAPSDTKKLDIVLENTISKIRGEFENSVDTKEINKTVNGFFKKLKKNVPNYDKLVSDLEGIADKSGSKKNPGKWIAVQQVLSKLIDKNSSGNDSESKSKTKQLKSLYNKIKTKYDQGNSSFDSLNNVISTLTPADKETIENKYASLKNYFSTSTDEGLDTKSIKDTLNKIYQDPKTLITLANNNLKEVNRESIISMLDNNTNIDKSKLNQYADTIESEFNSIKQKYYEKTSGNIGKSIENAVANFFNSTGRQEINYDSLKSDFNKILNNPKDSLDIIKGRLDKTNGETLKAILTNNKYISEQNIDGVVSSFESAKSEVKNKISQIEQTANSQVEIIKRKSVIQAEHVRSTAESAAWWLVLTAVLAAGAAMLGSSIAI